MAELWRYRFLILNLVHKELTVKYRGSALGFLWSLLNPIAQIVVYSYAFHYVIRVKISGPYHVVGFFMVGVLAWNFTAMAVRSAPITLVSQASLLRKILFPYEVLPVSLVLSNLVQFLLSILVLLPALALFHIKLSAAVFLVPCIIILHMLFLIGVGMVLATINVFFRDTQHFTELFLMLWFWLTPVVYSLENVPERFRFFYDLNPMTAFLTSYREVLLGA